VKPVLDRDRGPAAGRFGSRRVSDLEGRRQLGMECDVGTVGERRHRSGGSGRTPSSHGARTVPSGQSSHGSARSRRARRAIPRIVARAHSDSGLDQRIWGGGLASPEEEVEPCTQSSGFTSLPGSGSAKCVSSLCAGLGEASVKSPVPSRNSRRCSGWATEDGRWVDLSRWPIVLLSSCRERELQPARRAT
jgi:hypothetical protein